MIAWLFSLPDSVLLSILVGLLVLASLVLRQIELLLVSRGYVRVAAVLAAIRGLIVDAPSVAARILAAIRKDDNQKQPPKLPPGIGGMLLLSSVFICGCAAPLDAAKRSVNAARDVAPVVAAVIDEACTAEYKKLQAGDEAKLVALDRLCLPLRASYRALRAAHLAAVATILSVEAGKLDVIKAIESGAAVLSAIEAAQEAAAAVEGGAK